MSRPVGPLLVEVTRGGQVESLHTVDAVVVSARGVVVESWGEPVRPVLPRSSAKPIQAVPLVASGAAEALGLTDVELALACASHSGEAAHASAVEAWLCSIGASAGDLACGTHAPLHQPAAEALVASGREPTAVHNNCSGKHAGFLSICRHEGLAFEGYIRPDHQLQGEHVTPALEEWCGLDLAGQEPGSDGCGIPVWAVPLDRLACGWARLGEGGPGSPEHRLLEAMRSEPFLVAGTGRSCTRLITGSTGGTVVKTGAEGVYCGVVPEDGLGIAVKARDGAHRASTAAVSWILGRLGRLPGDVSEPVVNHAGTVVGSVRVRA